MKTLNVTFEDSEFEEMEEKKEEKDLNWRKFLLQEVIGDNDGS